MKAPTRMDPLNGCGYHDRFKEHPERTDAQVLGSPKRACDGIVRRDLLRAGTLGCSAE
ncbi:MAG: hypothetical protein CM1200mP2_28310 [Planctomycetaceae bacterium]|nr:MAG: hypothetical protein CM1200mP2_28310 [Planctomycetaceae bacterium]